MGLTYGTAILRLKNEARHVNFEIALFQLVTKYLQHPLKYHKNAVFIEVKIKLITALILPHFDDCRLVYHGLSDELNIRLQRSVNCGIGFIYDPRHDEYILPYRRHLVCSRLKIGACISSVSWLTVSVVSPSLLILATCFLHQPWINGVTLYCLAS